MRNGGYYVVGTRVSLASVIHSFRRGESPETILQNFPLIGSLAKVYGAITFILDNPKEVDAYLVDQEKLWDRFMHEHPISEERMEQYRSAMAELARKSA
ncbi:MAG: hypothetical protein HY820_15875 [Acidobacteria bacterium]|nr:hypothetical protein [Acidobacteriota bacterium]